MDKDKDRRISIRSAKKDALKVKERSGGWRCGMSKGTFSGVKVTVSWIAYVLLGSLAFQYLEQTTELSSHERDHEYWARFKELVAGQRVVEELLELKENLLEICPGNVMNKTFELLSDAKEEGTKEKNVTLTEVVEVDRVEESCGPALRIVEHLTETHKPSLVDAIYYTMTAVTTIGYGHIHPTTPKGRLFCVLYCLVGVPLTCILLAKSTDLLSSRMEQVYNTAKRRHRGVGRSLLYWVTTVYLCVGFLVFMLVPSIILTKLEPWTLEQALYLTFITLTTIGFGDFYPGYAENAPYENHKDLYKMCVIIWIMIALGYWFLLLNFLQKVLRKHVPRRLKNLKTNKKFKKQSEFFRQLVSKVMSQEAQKEAEQKKGGDGDDEESSGVVALMVEVADALISDETRRASMCVTAQGGRRESTRSVVPITLSQLLEVRVAVRGESIPSIRSFVATSPHPSSHQLKDLLTQESPKHSEVTLRLREVLTLISIIKSVEDEIGGMEGVLGEEMTPSPTPSSPLSTVTSSYDPQDCLPLIRSRKDKGQDEDEEEEEEEDDEEEEEEEEEKNSLRAMP